MRKVKHHCGLRALAARKLVAAHQCGKVKLAGKRIGGGGQRGDVFGEIGQHADIRQQAGAAPSHDLFDRPRRAAGIDPERDARPSLGRLAGQAGGKPIDQRLCKARTGGQGEDAGGGLRRKHHGAASHVSAAASASGVPTSRQPPCMTSP